MEAAGLTLSAVALATLFNACVECFETFSQGKNLQKDVSYLLIRLDFEKTQLLLWGNSSGILKVEKQERHAGLADPNIFKLVEDALKAIQSLLSDASLLSKRYGVETGVATSGKMQSTSTEVLSKNSMNWFRTAWPRFCIRAARVLPERGAPNVIARARWAIHDKAKFTELLETLSTLVEKLHSVIPVPDAQYDDLESDLAAILNISQLRLVEGALQYSRNPKGKALSKAASVIISESEVGTIDRRNVVDWLQDTQWNENPRGALNSSMTTHENKRLDLRGTLTFLRNKHQSLYFVNTQECMSSTLCPGVAASDRLANSNALPYGGVKKFHTNGKDSLRSLFPNLAKPENFHPYEYDELIENIGRSSGEAQELLTVRADQMIPFGVIYIHTSPCQFACQTAVDIADALKSKLIDAVVRIDDRISSSCFTSTADRIIVLQSILSHLHTLEPYGSSGWNCLDRIWLDQRLYSLESDPAASGDLLGTSNLIDVFSQEKFQDYQRPFAGVIIVGEVDVCGPLLQAEPFPRMPRPPRECEVYEITCTVGGYNRKYISKFVARPVPPKETQGQPGVDTRSSNLHLGKRPASPLASGSGKRQLTTSEKSDRRSQGSSSSSS